MSEHFTLFDLMGVDEHMHHVVGAGAVAVILTGVGLAVRAKASKVEEHLVPSEKPGLVNIATSIVSYFRNLAESVIGHGGEKYTALIGGIFLFILVSNYSGLIPGWLPPTENLNTNLAMALFVFTLYNILGIKEHGFGYIKQFTGGLPAPGYPMVMTLILSAVAILVFVIETMGHAFRPLSLSFRLWGNLNGDHILLGTVLDLVPWGLPIIAMTLGLLVGVIQALVFSLLTTVYIKLAVSHDH